MLGKLKGTFTYETDPSRPHYGDFVFVLDNGLVIDCSAIYNIYDTFNALARATSEEEQPTILAAVNKSQEASSKSNQKAYEEYMVEKYPGWRGLSGDRVPTTNRTRSRGPREPAPKLTLEDLGLAPKKTT